MIGSKKLENAVKREMRHLTFSTLQTYNVIMLIGACEWKKANGQDAYKKMNSSHFYQMIET